MPAGFSPEVKAAADTRFGDYQSNAAMVLGEAAQDRTPANSPPRCSTKLDVADLCEHAGDRGPGLHQLPGPARKRSPHGCHGLLSEDSRLGVPGDRGTRNAS